MPPTNRTKKSDQRDLNPTNGKTSQVISGLHSDDTYSFLSPPQQPGELGRLGTYRVLQLLGGGGMGVVFLAEDSVLLRQVALKAILPQAVWDAEARQRFLREARATAAIENDHVIPIYQVGEEKGVPFLAMPLLKGQPLNRWITRKQPLSVEKILKLGREIALGLAAAHERGLVHRDIKPANLWVESPNDRIKILDFGLVRPMKQEDTRLTQEGITAGTPAYMSPEQARDEALDHRSDLFSLGVVLYELCTNKLPFQGSTVMAVLMSLAVDTPRPIRELNPKIPPDLAKLIAKLMQKNPAARPASAQEVAARLLAISQADAVTDRVPPAAKTPKKADPLPELRKVERKRTQSKQTRRRLFVGAGAMVALLALAFVFIPRGSKEPEPKVVPAVVAKPPKVKVFLLAGQSNMAGKATIRTLTRLEWNPKDRDLFYRFFGPDGQEWTARKDVNIYNARDHGPIKGPLMLGHGEFDGELGPELMFGHAMGDYYTNPVLLIKVTLGGLSLAIEGRPPSSGGTTGPFYKRMIWSTKEVLASLPTHFPEYENREYELAGFVWFQDWNDHIDRGRMNEYEFNLTNLIRDVRKELEVPGLPVVIGQMGIGGDHPNPDVRRMRDTQKKVVSRPDFAGNVVLAETWQCWDTEAEQVLRNGFVNRQWVDKATQRRYETMACSEEYHYLGSGKTMILIGNSLAQSMMKLCPRE